MYNPCDEEITALFGYLPVEVQLPRRIAAYTLFNPLSKYLAITCISTHLSPPSAPFLGSLGDQRIFFQMPQILKAHHVAGAVVASSC